jgi:16S rRNA processing protein RimM
MSDQRVLIGVFGAPHGVRGEIRLKSYTADPAAVVRYGPVFTEDGRRFVLKLVRPLKDEMVVVRTEGVGDRDAAARLTNVRLYVPRENLPEPEEEEFYHSDLVGLRVETAEGEALGTVAAVVDFGAGDLLEVRRPTGGATVFLPFTKAFVPTVDLRAARMVAAPPAGLFDEGGEEEGPPPEEAASEHAGRHARRRPHRHEDR